MSDQEIVVKSIPAMKVAAVREVIPTYGDISQLYSTLFKHTGRHRARPAGPALAIYYDEGYRESDVDAEAAVPLSKDIPDGERVKLRELPAIKEMACTVHKGSYDTMAEAYNRLLTWIEANGYRICGPNREVYIKGPGLLTKPANYVTELQVPVEKA